MSGENEGINEDVHQRAPASHERDETDGSLRAERCRTDEEFSKAAKKIEEAADGVVHYARDQADETLQLARADAENRLNREGASAETRAGVEAEQVSADAILTAERRVSDLQLEREREGRQEALGSLLDLERGETDIHLSSERASSDEVLGQIGAELSESVRLRDEFLAMASHELRTPLTPLVLRLESLAQEAARQPASPFSLRVSSYVAAANRRLKRISSLVAELLDVSRINAGQLSLELASVDFGEVVNSVAAREQPRVAKAGGLLEVETAPVVGEWDELRLEQAVSCLLDNAIKYGLNHPIRIRLEPTSEGARLSVQDSGIGIAPENLERIFGRFERAVASHHYGGLGLGLYICRTIVEAMGGSISVQSELGKGSTFVVELPISKPPDPFSQPHSRPPSLDS